jgi:hypothetical protein
MDDWKSNQSTELRTHGDGNDSETMDNPTVVHRCKIGALFKGDSIDDFHL